MIRYAPSTPPWKDADRSSTHSRRVGGGKVDNVALFRYRPYCQAPKIAILELLQEKFSRPKTL